MIHKKVSKGYLVLRKRKNEKKSAHARGEKLWKAAVDKQANYCCEKCGTDKLMEHHHIHGRRYKSIEHDPDNGVLLCILHHIHWAHKKPREFQSWIRAKRGEEWWQRLLNKKNEGQGIYGFGTSI